MLTISEFRAYGIFNEGARTSRLGTGLVPRGARGGARAGLVQPHDLRSSQRPCAHAFHARRLTLLEARATGSLGIGARRSSSRYSAPTDRA